MFKSLFGLVEDVATIAAAPVKIVVGAARVVTAPMAEIAKDASEMFSADDEGPSQRKKDK